ncbi:N/A [soil metagenome]
MPAWIDVCALELPGHGGRMSASPESTIDALVAAVLPDVKELTLPVAIFGHSMGAILGFELCRALDVTPLHLFASASPPPDVPPRLNYSNLTRAELIRELGRWSNTPPAVLADEELMDLLLPIIQADLSIVDTYRGHQVAPVNCSITMLAGSADPDVTMDDARGWGRFTTREFPEPVVLDGGHFFLDAHAKEIQQLVARSLEAQLR